jgi:hypothetical protein
MKNKIITFFASGCPPLLAWGRGVSIRGQGVIRDPIALVLLGQLLSQQHKTLPLGRVVCQFASCLKEYAPCYTVERAAGSSSLQLVRTGGGGVGGSGADHIRKKDWGSPIYYSQARCTLLR